MNISTATIYARQGYSLRRKHWTGSIHIIQDKYGEAFVCGNGLNAQYFSFDVDDLLADDWEIIK